MTKSLPTRQLPEHPDLDQLKRQAKELLDAFRAADLSAAAEVSTHFRAADRATFALHDMQLVLARAYGFDSWPKLKAHVDGVTAARLIDAIRGGNLPQVRALLNLRPELARMSRDNLQMLHHAVLAGPPEVAPQVAVAVVRLLVENGADAHQGVYPHRDATSPLAIAIARGDGEIVEILRAADQRRRESRSGIAGAPAPDHLFRVIASAGADQAIGLLTATPALIHTCNAEGWTPLHAAARHLQIETARWLLDRGAPAAPRGPRDLTPLDAAVYWSSETDAESVAAVAAILRSHGAPLTAFAAVALNDADWLRARHAEGSLENPIADFGGLLTVAARHNRPGILALLLDFGFDPDERVRVVEGGADNPVFSWGLPLHHCAGSGKHEMAGMLLARGADPNGSVYASGGPMFQANSEADWAMVRLLESHGGVPNATLPGLFRQTELARRMLAGEAEYRLDGVGGETLAEQLLWGAACGGDPEIVRAALERVDWPRDDPRWFTLLEQPLRFWTHGSGSIGWDRATYLTCFRLLLERADPNLRGRPTDRGQFGLTMLHSVAGSRPDVTAEERVAFATALLDSGGRLDLRDNFLRSTPLAWACRYGRPELVKLFLARGASLVELDAKPWAQPLAWAGRTGNALVLSALGR